MNESKVIEGTLIYKDAKNVCGKVVEIKADKAKINWHNGTQSWVLLKNVKIVGE